MKKQCKRKVIIPMAPKGLRPKLKISTRIKLVEDHKAAVEKFRLGQAMHDDLLAYSGCLLTWKKIAELKMVGESEMDVLLLDAEQITQRYGRTGKVGFSGPEYQRAIDGVQIMDELADESDWPSMCQAVDYSQRAMAKIRRSHEVAT
jgi:hypothetical protein